jgi:uncharacterized heparinase superfamily protein
VHEAGRFAGYGASRAFPTPAFWSDKGDGLQFVFHLHGFGPLATYAAGEHSSKGDAFWERVVQDWLDHHSEATEPAWHPYPTSMRIVAWSAALSSDLAWEERLRERVAVEIRRQTAFVSRSVEHDVGGNHVIENAAAIAIGAACTGDEGLHRRGLRLLEREVGRQFLGDGGHEERSSSYHRELAGRLRDIAELQRRVAGAAPAWLTDAAERAETWMAALTGPDGRLPPLNDAWAGPACEHRIATPVSDLRDTGLVVLRHDEDQLLFDVAPLCPPHLPPHAHADALSVQLWLDGVVVASDPGVLAYTGPDRAWFRSTPAHSTVAVDDQDQCVFWGDFRAGQLPTVRRSPVVRDGEAWVVTGEHDGYRRLDDPVVHRRSVAWWPGYGAVVLDHLRCRKPHAVLSSVHLDPVATEGVSAAAIRGLGAPMKRQSGRHAVTLGCEVPTARLEQRLVARPGETFGWSLLRGAAEVVDATPERVRLQDADRRIVSIRLPAPDS